MEQPAPSRGSRGAALLALLTVGGSAIGMMLYQSRQNRAKPVQDNTGFDLSQAEVNSSKAGTVIAVKTPASDASSLSMVKADMPGMRFAAQSPAAASGSAARPARDLKALMQAQQGNMRALNQRYTAKYPAIAQFRRDWLASPDLKRLRDEFCGPRAGGCEGGDHDPIKFIRGVAASANFKTLLKQYAGDPAIHSYAMEAVRQAPSELMAAAAEFLGQDNNAKNFLGDVAQSLGLPAGLITGGEARLDQGAILNSIMKNNPELQKAMDSANAPKR